MFFRTEKRSKRNLSKQKEIRGPKHTSRCLQSLPKTEARVVDV